MKQYKFFAFLNRLKHINRWSLMRSSHIENVAEHSYFTALIAHALCVVAKTQFNEDVNADLAPVIALYHESSEVITGDLPTPIKYYNEQMREAYKAIEEVAEQQILNELPQKMRESLQPYVQPKKNSAEYIYVKFADKIAALIKCIEETASGNSEFIKAKNTIQKELTDKNNPAVQYFLTHFVDAFYLTLDELTEDK